jgi:hypothetical protein
LPLSLRKAFGFPDHLKKTGGYASKRRSRIKISRVCRKAGGLPQGERRSRKNINANIYSNEPNVIIRRMGLKLAEVKEKNA